MKNFCATFILFIFLPLSVCEEKLNINICITGLLSSIHLPWIDFFFTGWEKSRDWIIRCRRHDVRGAACGTLQPPLSPPPVRRDTTYQGGIRRTSHLLIFSASTTVPCTLPVWWILFSALLSWVIWGIIPKVSTAPVLAEFPVAHTVFVAASLWATWYIVSNAPRPEGIYRIAQFCALFLWLRVFFSFVENEIIQCKVWRQLAEAPCVTWRADRQKFSADWDAQTAL